MAALTLPASSRRAFDRLAADVSRVFGPRLTAVVATSPSASAVFVRTIEADDLEACAALAQSWHREGLATPVLLTPDEVQRSLDTFPLEYQALLDRHVVITGDPGLGAWEIRYEDMRRACETQARSHLIHLRQGWIETAGHGHERAVLIARSSAPLRALLTNVVRLTGVTVDASTDVAVAAANALGLPEDLLRDVLASETSPEAADKLVPRLPDYLAAAERLWLFVDGWRAS